MAIIISNSFDPYFNLATEEFFIKNDIINEDIFILWRSHKAFVFGRNQNPYIEINPAFTNKQIPIIRRISGGGTIYQDMNTINFSYITKSYESKINNYLYFLEPIISALRELDLEVKFIPKSHLFIEDSKVSGNAQAFINNKLLHHGTLLYNTDLSIIDEALVKYKSYSQGNHVLSNKQKVGNLINFLDKECSIDDLYKLIIHSVVNERNIDETIHILSKEEEKKIDQIAENKYKTWDWNFGKTKEFDAILKINQDQIDIKVDRGIVIEVSNFKYIKLIGLKFRGEEFSKTLKIFDIKQENE